MLQRLFRTLNIKRKHEWEMSFSCIKSLARLAWGRCNLLQTNPGGDTAVWYRWSNGYIAHLRHKWGHLIHTGTCAA